MAISARPDPGPGG